MKIYELTDGNTAVFGSDEEVEKMYPGQWTYLYTRSTLPSWSDTQLDQRYYWIDVGPFFDRFGAKALDITGSTDPQVQGLITLLLPRKYVDLKRQDLPSMLDLLVAKGLINSTDKANVLNPQTTEYERHIKDMPQPE